jgi:hypothetical protein
MTPVEVFLYVNPSMVYKTGVPEFRLTVKVTVEPAVVAEAVSMAGEWPVAEVPQFSVGKEKYEPAMTVTIQVSEMVPTCTEVAVIVAVVPTVTDAAAVTIPFVTVNSGLLELHVSAGLYAPPGLIVIGDIDLLCFASMVIAAGMSTPVTTKLELMSLMT